MTTVVTYGTFDLFHIGHVRLLKRLRDLGDRLVVGLSSDEFNSVKGKNVIIPYEDRREILLSCRYVDDVFQENSWEQKRDDLQRENASIFAMGDDWIGKFDDLQDVVKVVYLPRTQDVSTTELKTVISEIQNEKIRQIQSLASHLSRLIEKL
ncbi:adenylyltransferase/cytidyltransferase family protein [Alteromonas australica]|jgi:glycerol-3-phosphate cytidylyltransferase|uniref:adenylyltransferase/cytidyltransferase family protein n=1 Tax=Alteromonas australica TaxID=589873 RepID=UPI000C5C3928|nr:adenylyltransferase/cytidyltransferase family protein [Alteromonas australica]MBB67828.1 glycerol-3-phosphate cytidylyltransferase [Rickettsiales bacterium]|tara:strand:- start:73 stop:528 length:456 start_codon:yes stop_codon:yes gene_type:complete